MVIEYLLAVPILILLAIIAVIFYVFGGIAAVAVMAIIDFRESKKFRIHTEWQAGEYILGFLCSWFTVFMLVLPTKNTL